MPDVSLVNTSVTPVPNPYTVPGTQEILPKAVTAIIDGTGAAGSYLPALQLLDPAGHVMWTAVDTSNVQTAGGTVAASWFPKVGGGGNASSAFAQWFYANRTTTLNMAGGGNDTIPWSALVSSDSTLFSLGTVDHPNDAVNVARLGVLVISSYLSVSTLGTDFEVQILNNQIPFGIAGENTYTPQVTFDRDGIPGGVQKFGPRDISLVQMSTTPSQLVAEYTNYDAGTRTITGAQLAGLWWPTSTAAH